MKDIAGFNRFEAALIVLVAAVGLYYFTLGACAGNALFSGLELVAAVCGICSVVLAAKGKRSGFVFGFVNVAVYALISYTNQYYGEVMLNGGLYIPSNVVGFLAWSRHEDRRRRGEVESRSLGAPALAAALAVLAAATFAYQVLLQQLGGSLAFLDGFTTVASIAATVLMVARYAEQWALWIAVDVVTVVLWVVAGDPVMTVMWAAYLVNAVYGYALWLVKAGRAVPFAARLAR